MDSTKGLEGNMEKLIREHRKLRKLATIALENFKAATDENYADALLAYRDAFNKANKAFDKMMKAM